MSQTQDMILDCNGKALHLSTPVVMGILNVTPDSFSDGGQFVDRERALDHARLMVEQGAAIIDIGGESTRPGAEPVSESEEIDRVVPLIEALTGELEVPLSIDTSKAAVMREAVAAGAGLINDVRALREPGALEAAANSACPVCLMHMQGEPRSMQAEPHYDQVTEDIAAFFEQRIQACEAAGIARSALLLDPGFGFGKTLDHNLQLLAELASFERFGLPILVGVSRKSMFGQLLDAPLEDRLAGSLAAAVLALQRGANIIRAHDVAETCHAVSVFTAVREAGPDRSRLL